MNDTKNAFPPIDEQSIGREDRSIRLQTFAKVFYTELGQVLVTKEFDEEEGKDCLCMQAVSDDVLMKLSFGFETKEKCDEAFASTNDEKATIVATEMLRTFDSLRSPVVDTDAEVTDRIPQDDEQQEENYETTDKSEGNVN